MAPVYAAPDCRLQRTPGPQVALWVSANGTQGGDPVKLVRALVTLDKEAALHRRFLAGADTIEALEQKTATLQQQIEAHRAPSSALSI